MSGLAIDLFCGLGGWTEGLLAEGFRVVGFDNERHVYGEHEYPGQLVVQDVRTLRGDQFKDADLIVASPPCQKYSYMAMPFSRGKKLAAWYRADEARIAELNLLFDECFRIQREASGAAGRHVPLVVENVRGAQEWVGPARWRYGSFFLWGDVPALMPIIKPRPKAVGGLDWSKHGDPDYKASGASGCFRDRGLKNTGGSWFGVAHNTTSGKGRNPDGRRPRDAHPIKQGGDWFGDCSGGAMRSYSSKSPKRKMASAMIAKVPFELARYIGSVYKPGSA